MRITAGRGDQTTWKPCTGHPNDPRTDHDAINAAVYAETQRINNAIRNGSELSKYEARFELADHIRLDQWTIESLISAHLDGKADELAECIADIISDGLNAQAEKCIKEKSYA